MTNTINRLPFVVSNLDIVFANTQYDGTITTGSIFIPQSYGKTLTITSITVQGYAYMDTNLITVYSSRGDFITFATSDSSIQKWGATIQFIIT